IYNLDESGAKIRYLTREIVVIPIGVKELYSATLENNKSVYIIEVICTDGRHPLLLLIIYPAGKIDR
ncbi:hypothetical protein L873DRAFT_1672319, partial [Choiromyces venosus 120613-1]